MSICLAKALDKEKAKIINHNRQVLNITDEMEPESAEKKGNIRRMKQSRDYNSVDSRKMK